MKIDLNLRYEGLLSDLESFWELSGKKILLLKREYDESQGSPVFTAGGKYTTRGWTEWTQGFQIGASILQFDATGDAEFLNMGRKDTAGKMAPHVSHTGVHDHGFNNVSTYGNLLRLMKEGKIDFNEWEKEYYQLALKVSGAVQASRWTAIPGGGFIHSFNGPHSLFVDTVRSCRILVISHLLGHCLMGENDRSVNLLERAFQHLAATAKYSVFYGEGRDRYDTWGRTAHESVFNTRDGNFRCPATQQGYSAYSTWTRGLAWAMTGFAEELEMMESLLQTGYILSPPFEEMPDILLKAARATCDFYIAHSAADGIPYWDTAAPGLANLGDYTDREADPFNHYEPVDSSAAAIGAQGLLRLSRYLENKGFSAEAAKYRQAGLTVAATLFGGAYLATSPDHQGLLLHSVYHRPNGWDFIPPGQSVPCNESSMWGDYHIRELALYLQRIIRDEKYYTYFGCAL